MSMQKPSKQYPLPPATASTSTNGPFPNQILDPSIKSANFDQILAQRGVRVIHRKAVTCMNVTSMENQNHPPDCKICDGSRLVYYTEKEIWGIFVGNSVQKLFEHQGIWELGRAVMSFPTQYPDGEEADFATHDRLVLPDFTVRTHELVEFKGSGSIRTRLPVTNVDFIAAVIDGQLITYQQDVHFDVSSQGTIIWKDEHSLESVALQRPHEKIVMSIAYYTYPTYSVVQTFRELRVTQEMVNGVKQAIRLPQQVLVQREFLINRNQRESTGPQPNMQMTPESPLPIVDSIDDPV